MTPNQIVVVLRELTANERMAAVISTTMMEPGSHQHAWHAVLTALTYRAEVLRVWLAQAEPANVAAAEALIAAALVVKTTTHEPPAWTTDPAIATRVH